MSKLKLDKNKKYFLACSYGPDSMALFDMLLKQGYNFEVAHVNYHLRKESDSETEGLTNYCYKNGIKIYVLDYEDSIAGNVESECRHIRYRYFKELLDKYGYDEMLVAHNEDDLLETFFIQIDRKIDPIFYGIRELTTINGVKIRRPLLDYKKAELLEYCDKNNVPYAIDQSNFDFKYKRNEIRHNKVSQMNDEERRLYRDIINAKNDELKTKFVSFEKADLGDIKYILALDDLSQIYAINYYYQTRFPGHYLSRANVGEILKVLNSNKPNVTKIISGDRYLQKTYDRFDFVTLEKELSDYSYFIKELGIYDNDHFYFKCDSFENRRRGFCKSDFPLTIRNLKPEDEIKIKDYLVKARRLFIDWKMPVRLRKVWPCIVNNKGIIVYVPRYQKDFKIDKDCDFFVKVNK